MTNSWGAKIAKLMFISGLIGNKISAYTSKFANVLSNPCSLGVVGRSSGTQVRPFDM